MVSNHEPGFPGHLLQAGIWAKRRREKFVSAEPGARSWVEVGVNLGHLGGTH